jgi:DNA-binding winged helix-turn-helix (wHTH) protein/TolA-binding protein
MPEIASKDTKELYEFGPFRVDPEKELLLRAGEPVPLTPKAFQVLLVLVRSNKEVVTKDNLMKTVWPDTFVEEANLSRNIFMLRKALGEAPQDHQYILTVPGRGYRLAESVQLVPEHEISIVSASHSKVEVRVEQTRPWAWVAVGVVLLLAVAAGSLRLYLRGPSVLTEQDTVVLADFSNSTGDPVFDQALRQGMAIELEQSPFLSLISERSIQHTLRLMGRPADALLTSDLAREVCERTGSVAVLEGSIANLGSQYVLGLRAKDCRTGNVLAEEQAQSAKKEDVLNVLSQIAGKFRSRLGESLATVAKHNMPLAEASTSSLEALEAYSLALKVHSANGATAALPLMKHATEIDPQFAMAHVFLGRMYADLDASNLSAQSVSRAWQLRDRASDAERFNITAQYDMLVTGNLEKARQTSESWTQSYPRDAIPHLFLSGQLNKTPGQYETAAAEAEKAIALDPDFAMGYYNLAVDNVYLGKLAEGEKALRRAAARGLEIDELLMVGYDIAFLKGDRAGLEREAARAQTRSGTESWISDREAFVQAYSGHLRQARSLSHNAVDQALQAGQRERAGLWEAGAAVREAIFGNVAESTKSAKATLSMSKDREAEYGAAFSLALSGDLTQAQELADDLERRFPEDTSVRFSYLPVLRASLALKYGDAPRAIELLQSAAPHELGLPRSSVSGLFGALYPAYMRGEAYLAENEGAKAAVEFQKILDHRGIVVSDPVGAIAPLQLGRAYALLGDKAKAKAAYQDFLGLWKDGDLDAPILKQAKAEYGRLL